MRILRPGAAAGAPRAAIAPLLALCLACAVAPAGPPAPPPAAPPPVPAPAAPERPSAAGRYGPEPEVRLSPAESEAIEVARRRLARRGDALPRVSGALVLAARALARGAALGEAEPIGQQARRAALSAGLAYDPAPTAFLVRGPPERLGAHLAELIRGGAATHVGAGAVEVDGGLVVVVLASERKVRLEPIPRAVAPGAEAVLAGQLAAPLVHPRVFVTVPSGEVREVEARSGGGGAFRARLRFPEAGGYLVEVVAQGRGGPEVAALLSMSAGAAPGRLPAAAQPLEPEDPADLAAAEAAVVRAMNALRARRGLSPVTATPELTAVARAHSAVMLAQGKVAHVLPGSGELVDRLRRGGIPYRRAYENVARAGTALAAHAAAEESPAHLGNMLEPGATRVGVGIARGRAPTGGPAVYLTEILVEPPPDAGDGRLTPAARVAEVLWKERARLGRPPLTSDPALDAIARAAAADLARRDATEPGDTGRRALALGRKLAAVDVFVTDDPAGAARSANLGDARFQRVGIGAVTADSARYGPGRIFVTVLYTD